MILQSLVECYEALERKGKITPQGWCKARVAFVLLLSPDGNLTGVVPLKQEVEKGKKKVWEAPFLEVPQLVTRTSRPESNFLCDNSSYLLGIDEKGSPKRSMECFECAKRRHLEILGGIDCLAARAVIGFFETWKPSEAAGHPALEGYLPEMMAGSNLVFEVDGRYAQEDRQIRAAWGARFHQSGDGPRGICLVTGKKAEIARTHGAIKGVQNAQPNGAILVSFNEPAFESYGKKQSFNAPVGAYAANAYTAALNYLLADRKHSTTIGDTAIVYWSEDGEEIYQDVFSAVMEPVQDNQDIIHRVFLSLEKGRAVAVDDVLQRLDMGRRFYILGLSPNAARLAVRFFCQDSFGGILEHVKEHYERMGIVRPAFDQMEYLGIWRMLGETVNQKSRDKKPVPGMAAAVYRSVISGARYPDSLYQAVLGRIRAEQEDADSHQHKISRGRAAIIKAFLMRNRGMEEEITMALNEDCRNTAYILGREFAVLEAIQEKANREVNATIKDRYFNSACATPAAIFPILFKLKNSHIRKLDSKTGRYFEGQLAGLQEKLAVEEGQQTACPRTLSLEEQGMFILGYYHQTQKRYEKKDKGEQ